MYRATRVIFYIPFSQVVSLLLDHVDAKSAYEALLLAIKLGRDEIAEMILEHPKYDEITNELRSVTRAS